VPFRDKDKVHTAYRAEVSRLHDELDMSTARAGMAAFESAVNELDGNDKELLRQRDKLVRSLEMKRNEIKTFENNLGFFNSRSRSGEAMLRDMQHRIARLRDEQANIEKKIAIIDGKIDA
jgi:chromosome segregation ATPase